MTKERVAVSGNHQFAFDYARNRNLISARGCPGLRRLHLRSGLARLLLEAHSEVFPEVGVKAVRIEDRPEARQRRIDPIPFSSQSRCAVPSHASGC